MGFRLTGPGSAAELRYRELRWQAHAHAAERWAAGDQEECERFRRAARFFQERIDAIKTLRGALQQRRMG
jgi:hypothetical protein